MPRRRAHPDSADPAPEEVDRLLRRHEESLRRCYGEGKEAFPRVDLPFPVFARRLVALVHRRPLGQAGDIGADGFESRLARTGRRDLYLAIACEEKVPGAWEVFQETYEHGLRARAGRDGMARSIADGLLADLYEPRVTGASRTRLGSYDGSGPLGAWLQAVLRHSATDERRRRASEARRAREAGRRTGGATADLTTDPVAAVTADELRDRFEEALMRGWESLSPRESLAVVWKFRDGKPQVEIARLLGVGEPRVSRMLQSGIRKLRHVVTRNLAVEDDADLALAWEVLRDCAGLHLAARTVVGEEPEGEEEESIGAPGTSGG